MTFSRGVLLPCFCPREKLSRCTQNQTRFFCAVVTPLVLMVPRTSAILHQSKPHLSNPLGITSVVKIITTVTKNRKRINWVFVMTYGGGGGGSVEDLHLLAKATKSWPLFKKQTKSRYTVALYIDKAPRTSNALKGRLINKTKTALWWCIKRRTYRVMQARKAKGCRQKAWRKGLDTSSPVYSPDLCKMDMFLSVTDVLAQCKQ